MNYKITLDSDEVPKKWYNILADLPNPLPAPKNSEGKDQISDLQNSLLEIKKSQKNGYPNLDNRFKDSETRLE